MKNKFYITTTLPYINANPHIGFALEIIQADVIARHQTSLGNEVIFNTGTDEHGQKIYQRAIEEGKDPQAYADEYAEKYNALKKAFNLSYTNFIRTTDPHHVSACREFWKACSAKGDIYKKNYKIKYCVGCELEKTDSELNNDGTCPDHPNFTPEIREEENYFFRFSKYQKPLLEFYEKNPDFVVPDFRFNEIKNFVKSGLEDFSVSRLKEKMPWGIPVPDDDNQVMYVWFDALINYVSALGWPTDLEKFEQFWPGVQIAGKDNLRQQSAMWQAMLMSAGLPNSKQILIHGFITVDGRKISKSLGNVIDPFEVVKRYGIDPTRYYLLREIPSDEDGDFSYKKLEGRYNGDLANNLGNLVSRIAKLIETKLEGELNFEDRFLDEETAAKVVETQSACKKAIEEFRLHEALTKLWELFDYANGYINDKKPWINASEHVYPVKSDNVDTAERQFDGASHFIETMTSMIYVVINGAKMLEPFLPETAEKIFKTFSCDENKKDLNGLKFKVVKIEALFPRI